MPRGATPRPETCGERSRDAAEPPHNPLFPHRSFHDVFATITRA
jgi:hypothetical protein